MNKVSRQLIQRTLILPPIIWLLLLLPAGTYDFWEVYVYFALVVIFGLFAYFYLLKHNRQLLERRVNTGEKIAVQKVAVGIISAAMAAVYLIVGFDKRFAWSDIPIWAEVLGFVLFISGYYLTFLVLQTNSFATRTVEFAEGQKLVDTGVYGRVRHPMYTGFLIAFLGTAPALGSWWALTPIIAMVIGFSIRIHNEEAFLNKQLVGYREYCHRVRWRLIPGIW